MSTLPSQYIAAAREADISKKWLDKKVFHADVNAEKTPYCIMMPPPNVTGSLHLGHALTFTIQDILIRHMRAMGKDVLYQPGTDHAGIATQMIVERQLAEEGLTKHDLGREKFLERVWQWKEQSGGKILQQLEKLGVSGHWERSRFTMDDGLSRAVRKVFIELHKEGLIYRSKRLVNWDCKLHTAVSDLEVDEKENNGHMWYFKYPLKKDPSRHIIVGTTRPETLFGDTAVAVHPEDERYTDLIGETVVIPLNNAEIPIVADEHADPEKGSGAVKITPAHDFNDFDVGERNKLEMINILDMNGCMNDDDRVPAAYRGLDRFEARKKAVADMEEAGCLDRIEKVVNKLPYGDRSGTILEPRLTDQWFVNAEVLAKPAIEAVKEGKTNFTPNNWANVYFEWLNNIRPWCISRQIWWGHRIPAWYGPDGEVFVAESDDDAQAQAEKHYGKSVDLRQDEDVLDTWFSSALWPFSTLGWPDKTPELERYYPTNVLVTGFDIIFFWVARMMMMGLHFMKEVPFHTVYMHALVLDEKGQKMSKTKGNVIDPLEVIKKYGADSLRFALASLAVAGRDIKFSITKIEGARNFVTKLWNVTRFAEMHDCEIDDSFDAETAALTVNKWIVREINALHHKVQQALDNHSIGEGASALQHTIKGTFCDWYIEFIKPVLNGDDEAAKTETRQVFGWCLKRILQLLNPFMPFVTEEIWAHKKPAGEAQMLCEIDWPSAVVKESDAHDEMAWVIDLISEMRSIRASLNVKPSLFIDVAFGDMSALQKEMIARNAAMIEQLARVKIVSTPDFKGVEGIVRDATFRLDVAESIDIDAEKARLHKEITKVNKDQALVEKRMQDESFVSRAPKHIIEENEERLRLFAEKLKVLNTALERVKGL